MKIADVVKAVIGGKTTPPKGEICSAVSQAMQQHEVSVARLNRIVCDIEHGKECRCYEAETRQ